MPTHLLSLLLSLFLLLLSTTACDPPENECNCNDLRFPIFVNEVQGAEAIKLSGSEAGLALNALPGAKYISTKDLLEMQKIPATGLFLVDMDFIPKELPKQLEEAGYNLQDNGRLDSTGVLITLFVQAANYQLTPQAKSIENPPSNQTKTISQPRWAGYAFSFWKKYNGGDCTGFSSKTYAHAYEVSVNGVKENTKVEWVQIGTNLANWSDINHCIECAKLSSSIDVAADCFWPANNGASGYHYIFIADDQMSAHVNWSW